MFQADEEDGTLDLLLLSSFSPTGLILTKVFGHWLTTGLPLIIATPYVAMAFNLEHKSMMTLMLSMLLGTPVLSLVGAVGAALTVGIRRGGMLLSLLLLPIIYPGADFWRGQYRGDIVWHWRTGASAHFAGAVDDIACPVPDRRRQRPATACS